MANVNPLTSGGSHSHLMSGAYGRRLFFVFTKFISFSKESQFKGAIICECHVEPVLVSAGGLGGGEGAMNKV